MRQGALEQVDTPEELYSAREPVRGRFHRLAGDEHGPGAPCRRGRQALRAVRIAADRRPAGTPLATQAARKLQGQRSDPRHPPEDLEDAEFAPRADPDALLDVEVAWPSRWAPSSSRTSRSTHRSDQPRTRVTCRPTSTSSMPTRANLSSTARIDSQSSARDGKPLKVVFDVTRLYFFDRKPRLRSGSNDDARTAHRRPRLRSSSVDPRLFGTFVEHLGRCVYTGSTTDAPIADRHGFRPDVLDLARELAPRSFATPAETSSPAITGDGVGPSRSGDSPRPRLALYRATRSARTSSSTGRASPASSQCWP